MNARRLALALVLLALAALLLWKRAPEPPEAAAPRVQREVASVPRTLADDAPPPVRLPNPVSRAPSVPNTPPRFNSARLDQPVLCPGQSTFLRMEAEDSDDTDLRYQAKYLSPVLGAPRFGFGRWLRYQAPERTGRYSLVAVVEDPERARDELPLEVIVKECGDRPAFAADQLRIAHTELDALVHEFDLSAAQRRARDAGHELSVNRWHFGDGQSAGAGLRSRHHYPVVLDRRYSYYLVQAEAELDGAPLRIEYGLSFYSYAAANLESGYVALAADVERGDDTPESIEYVVTFSNLTPFGAWARELQLTCLDAAGVPSARWRERLDLTVPGEASLEQTLSLDRVRCPGGARYELFGEADGGYAVGGLWSYRLRPRTPPLVEDPAAARRRARLVLDEAALPAAVTH